MTRIVSRNWLNAQRGYEVWSIVCIAEGMRCERLQPFESSPTPGGKRQTATPALLHNLKIQSLDSDFWALQFRGDGAIRAIDSQVA